jgi:hypothetical protein
LQFVIFRKSEIFIVMRNNNQTLITLPFGTKFKNKWLEYVSFTKGIGGNTSIYAQNWVLTKLIAQSITEADAIIYIEKNQKTATDIVLFKSLRA